DRGARLDHRRRAADGASARPRRGRHHDRSAPPAPRRPPPPWRLVRSRGVAPTPCRRRLRRRTPATRPAPPAATLAADPAPAAAVLGSATGTAPPPPGAFAPAGCSGVMVTAAVSQ